MFERDTIAAISSPPGSGAIALLRVAHVVLVGVGGEQQREPEHGEEVADQEALLPLRRIDRGDESEPQLLRDHRARHLQRRQRHAANARGPNHRALFGGVLATRRCRRGQDIAEVAEAAHRVEATVELAVLLGGDTEPHPRADDGHGADDPEHAGEHDGA